MLYKYLSDIPFIVDDKPVIQFGDTIALTEENAVKNVTSGTLVPLEPRAFRQDLMYILQNSSRIDDVTDEQNDLFSIDSKSDRRPISNEFYNKLNALGILDSEVRGSNVGASDYSQHIIQPWSIWKDYNLNPWDADIVKRVLRTKKESGKSENESRIMDYEKIIHICKERIRQLKCDRNE